MTETYNLGDQVQRAQFSWDFETNPPLIRDIARNLAQFYLGVRWSKTQWKTQRKPLVCRWRRPLRRGTARLKSAPRTPEYEDTIIESEPLDLDVLTKHITENRGFNPEALRLPPPLSPWLDASVTIGRRFPGPGNSGAQNLQFFLPMQAAFGDQFPIYPRIDREGICSTNMQNALLHSVAQNRVRLVQEVGSLSNDDWLHAFRTLVSDTVSWMDITLNALYLKAQRPASRLAF